MRMPRLRTILLVPLALFGGPMWEGMAWLLIFGLAIATLLTLVLLPIIYAVFVEYFGMTSVKKRAASNGTAEPFAT